MIALANYKGGSHVFSTQLCPTLLQCNLEQYCTFWLLSTLQSFAYIHIQYTFAFLKIHTPTCLQCCELKYHPFGKSNMLATSLISNEDHMVATDHLHHKWTLLINTRMHYLLVTPCSSFLAIDLESNMITAWGVRGKVKRIYWTFFSVH